MCSCARIFFVTIWILLSTVKKSKTMPTEQTKYNILVKTLFYMDKQGRVFLATRPLSSHTERIIRENLREQIDVDKVDQIRIEPAFNTVQDVTQSMNETFEFLQKNYPTFLTAKLDDIASTQIASDMRRNSQFNDDYWYYNVVSLNYSPPPGRASNQTNVEPSDKASSKDDYPSSNHDEDENSLQKHNHVYELLSTTSVYNIRQTTTNKGHIEPVPSNHEDLLPATHINIIQPPYHQSPIGQTTPEQINSSPHGHDKRLRHHGPGGYDTTTKSNNFEPPMEKLHEVIDTKPPNNFDSNYEPAINMSPAGKPEKRTPNGPPNEKVNEPPSENGSNETLEESSYQKTKQNHVDKSMEYFKESWSGKGPMVIMTSRKPPIFVPNDIFYAIEKRCANWSDDCTLNKRNKIGFNNQMYAYFPPKAVHWPMH